MTRIWLHILVVFYLIGFTGLGAAHPVESIDDRSAKNDSALQTCEDYIKTVRLVAHQIAFHSRRQLFPWIQTGPRGRVLDIHAKISCIPVDELDRTARSEGTVTTLKWRVWRQLSSLSQLRLATHEIAIMANAEEEGEYSVSNRWFAKIKNSEAVTDYLGAESFIQQGRLVTLIHPFQKINAKKYKLGYQIFADPKNLYKFGDEGDPNQLRATSADLQNFANRFCKVKGFAQAIQVNYERHYLKGNVNKFDPVYSTVPTDLDLADVKDGFIVPLERRFDEAVGYTDVLQVVTCQARGLDE